MTRHPCIQAAGILATVAGLVGVAASPAAAVVRDVDRFTVNSTNVDFGAGPFVVDHPSGPGTLTWDEATNTVGKPVTGRLTGTVWWANPNLGGCAIVRIQLYNTAGALLVEKNSAVACRTGAGTPTGRAVDIAVSNTRAHRMVITTLFMDNVEAGFGVERTVTRYWGQLNGVLD